MLPRIEKGGGEGFWGRAAVCNTVSFIIVFVSLADTKGRQSEPSTSESPPAAEIEPTPFQVRKYRWSHNFRPLRRRCQSEH